MPPSLLDSHPQARLIAACVVPLAWMGVSSGLILLNKHLMMEKGFKYPMTLSGLGQAFSAFAAFACCHVLKIVPMEKTVDLRFFAVRMLPVGFFMALTLMCGNTVYMYLTVAFIQMLKAFTPVITMLGLFLAALERPTRDLVASVCIITAGTALAGYGEVNASIMGMVIQLISESAEAGRLIMTQTLLQGMSFHPIEGLMYLAPASVVWMVLFAAIFEWPGLLQSGALGIVAENPGLFMAAATMGFGVMLLSFFTIQLCGSLTLKVLGTVKNAALVLFCVVFLAEQVTGVQGTGYTVSLLGFSWYQYIKTVGPANAKPAGGVPVAHAGSTLAEIAKAQKGDGEAAPLLAGRLRDGSRVR